MSPFSAFPIATRWPAEHPDRLQLYSLPTPNGVKVSIAVTGFESSEQSVTEQNAVLKVQPRLVVVAETNAWGWQTRSPALTPTSTGECSTR